jgi:hypothetical protein
MWEQPAAFRGGDCHVIRDVSFGAVVNGCIVTGLASLLQALRPDGPAEPAPFLRLSYRKEGHQQEILFLTVQQDSPWEAEDHRGQLFSVVVRWRDHRQDGWILKTRLKEFCRVRKRSARM